MKKNNKIFLIVMLCSLSALITYGQHYMKLDSKAEADKIYKELEQIRHQIAPQDGRYLESDPDTLKVNRSIRSQRRMIKYRDLGLLFWNKFPNDERRYEWFRNTVWDGQSLAYWEDIENGALQLYTKARNQSTNPSMISFSIPMNLKALQQWEKRYPKMRQAYFEHLSKMKAKDVLFSHDRLQDNIYNSELRSFLALSLNIEYRKGRKVDLERLKRLFVDGSDGINRLTQTAEGGDKETDGGNLNRYLSMDQFTALYTQYGLDAKDMNNFFRELVNNPNKGVRIWASRQLDLFKLMVEPLQLKHVAMDGREIDLDKMRGKVVLVDFWAIGCSDCIARMPAIKTVYDKYKSQGFEVISACANGNSEKELKKIMEIEQKIGADWPVLLIGGKAGTLGYKIFWKYGFMGVPQLLLLNKQGKLIVLNDVLRRGDFEPEVKKLLAEPYPTK